MTRAAGLAGYRPSRAGQVGSAAALVDVVHDRTQPQAANELLLALVRVGSADGGVDESAATFVATLLAPGATGSSAT